MRLGKRLTKRAVDAVHAGEKEIMLWDGDLRGFGVRVKPSGTKTYFIQYRNSRRRTRKFSIGQHGMLAPDEARKIARQLLAEVARGADPSAERKTRRDAETVSKFLDRFEKEHIAENLAVSTAKVWRYLIKTHIRPALGSFLIAAVTKQDIIKLHRSVPGQGRQANNVLTVLSSVFAKAEEWGARPEGKSPVAGVQRHKEKVRERFLSDQDITHLGKALRSAEEGDSEHPIHLAAVRLLLFSGARTSEVLSLEWRHVDFNNGLVAFPGVKGGERLSHPVSGHVIDILQGLPRVKGSPWILPMPTNPAEHVPYHQIRRCWDRLRTKAKLHDVRLHDLRHTVGTFGGQLGANAFMVRDMLRHRTLAMTSRYANRDNHPVRELSEKVAGRISAALQNNRPDEDEEAMGKNE
ncbi:MAG: integrase arm-type DNA-binding domain-containing protein [Roseibium sp.]|uniref:tyrosine-type recombinase/integrase n=1 Tax=Roseibium sp. TaxID=1936156 RepID=UPI003D9C3643